MKTLLTNVRVFVKSKTFEDAVGFDSSTGVITFAGSNEQSKSIVKEYDEVVDLAGRLVIPAFTEGHCHFIEGSFVNSQLDLRDASCREDFVDAIVKYKSLGRKWIFGGYFTDANITDGFRPTVEFLDEICPDVPVIISRFDIHSAFANTLALKLGGIADNHNSFTSDEVIIQNGRLTGELKERARDHVLEKIPPASFDERLDISFRQMKKLHSLGITAISDITLIPDLEVYKAMLESGKFKLRVDARLRFEELENLESIRKEFAQYQPQIKFDSLKAFYDGSLSSRTSYMHDNFKHENHNGIRTEFVNCGDFEKCAFEIDKAGVQMSIHAIGDKAVTDLLDLAEELNKRNGKRDRRFRIEHAQHIQPRDFRRFAELDVIASVQPTHLYSDAKTATELLTDDSLEHNYPEVLKHGAMLCFGTDFPVVGESPFETIYFAMTRKAKGFDSGFHPEYNMTLDECLHAHTYANAFATFEEKTRGTLEPGMIADIAVIDGDLFEMNENEIRDAKVYATYFGGERIENLELRIEN